MVNSGGQLYTIEGVAAALIILITAFIVVNSTSVYTPGDAHISDMQLEIIGSDALRMMNVAPNSTMSKSPLQTYVETDNGDAFREQFDNIVNNRSVSGQDRIKFVANVTYVAPDGSVNSSVMSRSSQPLVGLEHPVRVSEWLIVDKTFPGCAVATCKGKHAVIVEVLLWRD